MLGVSTPRGGAYRPCVKIKSRWTQNPEPAVQTVKGEVDCYARWRLRKVETTLHGASLGSSRDGSVNSPRYSLYLDGSGSCMNRHDYRGPKGCRPSGLFVFELSHDNKGRSCPLAWCSSLRATTITGLGREDQAARVGRLTRGSSPIGAMLSRVM